MNLPVVPVRHRLDRSRHAAPQIFDCLREGIISMSYVPGAALSRTELAESFGVSQTPVRDALQRLAEEQLVDVFPQHATIVRPIDLALARQAHFLRLALEVEIVGQLAQSRDDVLVVALENMVKRQQRLVDDGDQRDFVAADQAFHRALYDAAHVPDLYDVVRKQSGHLDRLRHLHLPVAGKRLAVVEDHAAIVAALRAGHVEDAQQAVRRHLSGTLRRVEDIRSRYPEYLLGE